MRALLVEDDDHIRLLMSEVLSEGHGHEVAAFATAEAAWDSWSAWRDAGSPEEGAFPLIVLDWMLPGMSGLELCRRLREAGAQDSVILVVTAKARSEDLRAVLDAGADDYLSKPFVLDTLDVRLAVAARHAEQVARRVRAEQAARDAARLEGVLLAARTAAHEINNALSLPVGYAELLTLHPAVGADPELLRLVTEIRDQTERASEILTRLQRVIRLEESPMAGKILDLDRSVGAS